METPEIEGETPPTQPAWRHRHDTAPADTRPSGDPTPPVAALAAETPGPTETASASASAAPRVGSELDSAIAAATPPAHHAPRLTPDTDCVIAVRDLRVSFGDHEVLHGVDLYAPRNTVVALVGPSGCGKTTLLRTVNRLTELVPTARVDGRIELDGENIFDRGRDINLLRRRVGMVFQQPNPFPMSIFDNVAFALREQARRRPRRKDLMPKVEHALQRAGLWDEVKDHLDRSALSLSGGQQQRLCIARTLAANPEVILMDEPASALDPRSTARIEELILQIKDDITIIIVTHNLAQARRTADYAAFLLNGDMLEQGDAEQVLEHPQREETQGFIAGAFG